jgi:hypothetical protein
VSAVETQSDVGVRPAVFEDMAREPHDWRRVVDTQPVPFAAKSHLPGWLRRRPNGLHCRAHSRYPLPTPLRMGLYRHRAVIQTPMRVHITRGLPDWRPGKLLAASESTVGGLGFANLGHGVTTQWIGPLQGAVADRGGSGSVTTGNSLTFPLEAGLAQ